MVIVVECRPAIVADKTRPIQEHLSHERKLYGRLRCVEVLNIGAYAYQDVHVRSAAAS